MQGQHLREPLLDLLRSLNSMALVPASQKAWQQEDLALLRQVYMPQHIAVAHPLCPFVIWQPVPRGYHAK